MSRSPAPPFEAVGVADGGVAPSRVVATADAAVAVRPRGVSLLHGPRRAGGERDLARAADGDRAFEPDAGAAKVRLSEVKALRDRRGDPGPRAKEELEVLQYGLETVEEDVEACLADWKRADPSMSGKLMIAFRLDATGLTEAWVAEHDDIPFGAQTCFANAVTAIDWSNIVDRPVEITQRYELPGTPDGGVESAR